MAAFQIQAKTFLHTNVNKSMTDARKNTKAIDKRNKKAEEKVNMTDIRTRTSFHAQRHPPPPVIRPQ